MMEKNKKINFFSVDIIAYLLIIFFIIIFIFLSLGRHAALKSFQNDLGTYSQLTWNNLHGNFFESSGSMVGVTLKSDGSTNENFNYLSAHFSPILLFFVPFYAICADPRIFLIIQVLACGIGALPIYWLAKEKLKSYWAGLVFLISFLLYPVLHNALLYDFHEVTLAVPFVTFFLWFWHKNKTGWMIFFIFLLLITQEHISLIIFMFGLYLAFFQKKWKLGLGLAAFSLVYFFVILLFVIPSFSVTGESALIKASNLDTRYSWLGTNLSEIFRNIIQRPWWVIKYIFGPKQMDFFITLLLPLLGLSIFSALFILTLPVLILNFLSGFTMTYNIYFYHSVIISGIIYFSAILAFAKMVKQPNWQRFYLIIILLFSIITSYLYSVTPLSANYSFKDYQPSTNAKLLTEVKPLIPANAAVTIQHNLGPHFANRRKLFQFPFMVLKSDYVILDLYNPYADNPKLYFNFSNALTGIQDYNEKDFKAWLAYIYEMFEVEDFGVIYSKDGWLVFKRGASQELNKSAKKDFEQALERFLSLKKE